MTRKNYRSHHWGWYTSAPKKDPPKHGIKIKNKRSTWWGQSWIDALAQMSLDGSSRLSRGRGYARAGRVHDLIVEKNTVVAKVTGSRSTPYRVTITLSPFPNKVWNQTIARMAQKAHISVDLLSDHMPENIDVIFKHAGTSLFPTAESDLITDCSCPDWGNPCKHVAATHYVLGQAIDRDPFLLFELRGISKVQLLAALRRARASVDQPSSVRDHGQYQPKQSAEIPSVYLGRAKVSKYDRLREPLPTLQLSFEAPPDSGQPLQSLGNPSDWSNPLSPSTLLAYTIRTAAKHARALAMAKSPVNSKRKKKRSRTKAKTPHQTVENSTFTTTNKVGGTRTKKSSAGTRSTAAKSPQSPR